MLEKLTSRTSVSIVCAVYMVLTFTLPVRRMLPMETTSFSVVFFYMHLWAPIYALIPMVIMNTRPNHWIARLWICLSHPHYLMPLGYAMLAMMLIFTFTGVPGIWWTWLTLGVHICGVLLIATALRGRVPRGEALALAVGFISLAIGTWEIPYQMGLYYNYNYTWVAETAVIHEVMIELPFILGGLLIMFYYAYIHGPKLFRPNRAAVITFVLYVGAWIAWFTLGFWVDILYNAEEGFWYHTPANPLQMSIYRSSKVLLNLIPVILLWRRYSAENERLLNNTYVVRTKRSDNTLFGLHASPKQAQERLESEALLQTEEHS